MSALAQQRKSSTAVENLWRYSVLVSSDTFGSNTGQTAGKRIDYETQQMVGRKSRRQRPLCESDHHGSTGLGTIPLRRMLISMTISLTSGVQSFQ